VSVDLFAGIPVSDYATALTCYERLLGSPPTFLAHEDDSPTRMISGHRLVDDPFRQRGWLVLTADPGRLHRIAPDLDVDLL